MSDPKHVELLLKGVETWNQQRPSGAYLSGANLIGADLSGANLSGATGIIDAPVADPRGYRAFFWKRGDEWCITSGCRTFPLSEGLAHWGQGYASEEQAEGWERDEIGELYTRAIQWMQKRIASRAEKESDS